MNETAIYVDGLSKQYRIGSEQAMYKTLRDSITKVVAKPFRALRSNITSKNGSNNGNSKGGEKFWALKDISFEVKRGEVLGIIGKNGAGKSTLLKVLSRITEPTNGYADIYGRVGSLLEVGTGFNPELTGRENIFLNGAILGMTRAEILRKFDEIVAFAEVEKFIDTPVKHYSSGMYLRLGFAVAAHLEPEILLVDEVLAVGDISFQKKCLGKMGDVAKEGRTVIFVSHNMSAVKGLCHTSLVLDNGKIDFQGSAVQGLVHYSRSLTQANTDHPANGNGWSQVCVNGEAGVISKPISTGDPFFLTAILQLRDGLKKARLYCLLEDSSGGGVVHNFIDYENCNESGLKEGLHKIRADVPSLWLMPDAYTVYFKIIGQTYSGNDFRHSSERVILDITDSIGQSVGNVRATLIPPIKWSLTSN